MVSYYSLKSIFVNNFTKKRKNVIILWRKVNIHKIMEDINETFKSYARTFEICLRQGCPC